MAAYALLIIWLVSHVICIYIAKKRNVKLTLLRRLVGIFLGPLAIPFVFFLNQNMNIEN